MSYRRCPCAYGHEFAARSIRRPASGRATSPGRSTAPSLSHQPLTHESVQEAITSRWRSTPPLAGSLIAHMVTMMTPWTRPSPKASSPLECELLERYDWPTRQALRTAVFDFIEVFYNRLRRHSTLDYRTDRLRTAASIASTRRIVKVST
jgi:hypothetical protein